MVLVSCVLAACSSDSKPAVQHRGALDGGGGSENGADSGSDNSGGHSPSGGASSSHSGGRSSTGDAGPVHSGGGSSREDSGAGGSSGGADSGVGAGDAPYTGVVDFSEGINGTRDIQSFYATFFEATGEAAPSKVCTGTSSGSCCFALPPPPSTAKEPRVVEAGTLTATDGGTSGTLKWLAATGPDAGFTGAYENPTGNLAWKPGDTLQVKAAGGIVDAFVASVVAASSIADLTPTFVGTASLSTSISVSRTAAWVLSWTPDKFSKSDDQLLMNQGQSGSITCAVPDSAGTVTVPTELLQKFPAGTRFASRFNRSGNVKNLRVGNVDLVVSSSAFSDTFVTLQ